MDWPLTVTIIGALGAIVALFGISTAANAAKDKRAIDHAEFKEKLQPGHEEALAGIAARRDSEIVKYTGKPVPVVQQIDNR